MRVSRLGAHARFDFGSSLVTFVHKAALIDYSLRTSQKTFSQRTILATLATKSFRRSLASFVRFSLSVFLFSGSLALASEDHSVRMGTDRHLTSEVRRIKIAVLDNGFGDFKEGDSRLPSTARLIPGSVNAPLPTDHGLRMAEIVWDVTGRNPVGPQFYLINSNGFSNFVRAVDFAIANKVDILLFAQVWEFGSNFKGDGFLNAQVRRAREAGILWVNAAGNYGARTWTRSVLETLDLGESAVPQICVAKKASNIRLTLSWTDFQEDPKYVATTDLDLALYDREGNLVGESVLVQGLTSRLARETIELRDLKPGCYDAVISSVKPGVFIPEDQLRLSLFADSQVLWTGADSLDSILPPADSSDLITVGELEPLSSLGQTSDGRWKPEVLVPNSSIQREANTGVRGSSTAAALWTGWLTIYLANRGTTSLPELLDLLKQSWALKTGATGTATPLSWSPEFGSDLLQK